MANDKIEFSVRGIPIPKGSKRAFIPKGTNKAIVVDANPKTKPWQVLIKHVAGQHAPLEGLWDGPVGLSVCIWMPRPKTVPKSRLGYPIVRPDSLKLCRAVEDSLTGVIYRDDANVVDLYIQKRYGPPGVDVCVWKKVRNLLTRIVSPSFPLRKSTYESDQDSSLDTI